MPSRIQLRRSKGWRLPAVVINVARPARCGNPYPVEKFGRELAVLLFRHTVNGVWSAEGIPDDLLDEAHALHQAFLQKTGTHPSDAAKAELKGLDLACWCGADEACHADIQPSPVPWSVKRAGGYIAILDRDGKVVMKKVVNMLSIAQYEQLSRDFDFIVGACNAVQVS